MSATMQPMPAPAPANALALAGLSAGAPPGAADSVIPWPLADDGTAKLVQAQETANPLPEAVAKLHRWIKMDNIADDENISDEELSKLAFRVSGDFDIDENSRADWKTKYEQWMKFAMQITEEKSYPWPQASNIIYPLLTSAALQFAARAYPAIIRDRNVVKGTVIGSDDGKPAIDPQTGQPQVDQNGQPVWIVPPGDKLARATRIGEHMSWQLLDEQEEWEPETDALLVIVAIAGCMFRTSYFDSEKQRNVSQTISGLDLVVNYKAKSFEAAPRKTQIVHLYPWEIEERIRAGIYLDQDYGHDMDGAQEQDEDATVAFLEQHRRWDLDGDGYAEPYIVTISRDTKKIARIVAGFDEDSIKVTKNGRIRKVDQIMYFTPYIFMPSPDGGVYGMGFGALLYPINAAINSSLNQMFDAGHLQNAGGGFIGSQLSMNTGAVRFQVGEYKPVNTNGGTIRDNVFPLPFQGPSPVLFELLKFLVEAGKEIAATKDIMVGDMPGDNVAATTTLAVIEQGLKVFSAIYKRIHRSLKSEYAKLYRLNRLYLPLTAGYQVGEVWKKITRKDYEIGSGVEPVSDPQMMTDMQRLGRAQFLGNFKDDPWFDGRLVRQKILEAAQITDADKLLVNQPPPNPKVAQETGKIMLKHEELNIRAANEEAERDIKRGMNNARQVEMLASAIEKLSMAAKNDHAAAQGWYDRQLQHLKLQVDAMNDAGNQNPAADSPSAAAAGGGAPSAGGAPGAPSGGPGGPDAPAIPAMATPPGQPGVPAVSPGLSAGG